VLDGSRTRAIGFGRSSGVLSHQACSADKWTGSRFTNTVPAINIVHGGREKIPAAVTVHRNQTFKLFMNPVISISLGPLRRIYGSRSERVGAGGMTFSHPAKEDPHFTSNRQQPPRYLFGDGTHGRIPSAGALIVARPYRFGGESGGNVAPDAQWSPGNEMGWQSSQRTAAVGGRAE